MTTTPTTAPTDTARPGTPVPHRRAGARVATDPWLVFFALVALAWAGLAVAAGGDRTWHADVSVRGHLVMTAMWALMSVAMMAPTATPLLRTYRELTDRSGDRRGRGFHSLLAGYLVVWAGFSVAAATLQHGLAHADLITPSGRSASTALTAALLAAAGAYQFSPLKQTCLTQCRTPMTYFLSRWRPGPWGAFTMGLHHGTVCVGCCAALMVLALVGGAMNLLWMGAATALMAVEKLPMGRRVTVPLGVALLASAALVAAA